MSLLGDVNIATQPPLQWRLVASKSHPRKIEADGHVTFTIDRSEVLCADRVLTNPLDVRIALALAFYGEWNYQEPKAIVVNGELEAVEYSWKPEVESGQGFEVIGALSSLFSSFYGQATLDDGKVVQLQ